MPAEGFANDFQTTLSAAVTTTAAISLNVNDAAPADLWGKQFRIRVGDIPTTALPDPDYELMLVAATGASGASPWTVDAAGRGIEGTTAITHANGTPVVHLLTAGALAQAGGTGSGAILPWATGTQYIAGQPVTNGGHTYTANDAHTAGATFAGDLAAHWTLLPLTAADVGAASTTYADQAAANSFQAMPRTRPNCPSGSSSLYNSLGSSNRAIYMRALGTGPIANVVLDIGGSSGNISIAICTSSAQRSNPSARVASSGAIACPASGVATVSLGATVTIGPNHWFAVSADNTTFTIRSVEGTPNVTVGGGATGFGAYQDGAHPIPSTPSPGAGYPPTYWMVGV